MPETTSRATMNAWANAVLGTGQSRQGGGPRTPLYSRRAMAEADDVLAPPPVVPPSPPKRRTRRTRPVVFVCVQTPGLALGLASGGLHEFTDGRLTLDHPEDIAAMRKHAWYGGRILETPKMDAEIAVQQLLHGRQRLRQRELAGDAQLYSREMGGRGPFGPDPDTGLGRFPVRRR